MTEESFSPAALIDLMERTAKENVRYGLLLRTAAPGSYVGSRVVVDGREMANFACCSYLGLEQRAELREGAIDAIRRYGTQLSISRAYLESPLYVELEDALREITGGSVLVASSVTAAHLSALPALMRDRDIILIDKAAHASLHTAAALVRGTPVLTLPHGRLDVLEDQVRELARKHERVWYVLDGLFSMSGEFAPFAHLAQLLTRHPKLHLYVDDAHATSWCGRNGRGATLDLLPDTSRVVVALSLNKAFAAAGGAVVFPSDALRDRARLCGGPMMFSGPIQPPMLGAAVASARLHLDPAFANLQQHLCARIRLMHGLAREYGVPLATSSETPIVNLQIPGVPAVAMFTRRLWERGFFVSPSAPPAVPPERCGIRMTLSLLNSMEDIQRLMETLAEELKRLARGTPMA
jgi:7-keto-8-aminopelargonate synthetase-like enzyme